MEEHLTSPRFRKTVADCWNRFLSRTVRNIPMGVKYHIIRHNRRVGFLNRYHIFTTRMSSDPRRRCSQRWGVRDRATPPQARVLLKNCILFIAKLRKKKTIYLWSMTVIIDTYKSVVTYLLSSTDYL